MMHADSCGAIIGRNDAEGTPVKIYEVDERTPELTAALTELWEASVRETHHFLSEAEIVRIGGYVPQALRSVHRPAVAEDASGTPVGFMGVENGRIEMLFLSPAARGHGIGRQLAEYGIGVCGADEVTVNEQNPQALGFYRHMGFEVYRRTECDEQGGPYPLLYMRLTR